MSGKHDKNLMNYISDITLGIEGVSSMAFSLTDGIPLIGRKVKGVEIKDTKQGLIIDLFVNVLYGVNIPTLSWEIQTRIKEFANRYEMRKIKEINVHIQGVEVDRR